MEKIIFTTKEKLMRFDNFAKVLNQRIVKPSIPFSKPIELKKVVSIPTIVNIPPQEIIKNVEKQITPLSSTNFLTSDVVPTDVSTNVSTNLPKESNANFWWGVGIVIIVIGGGLYLYRNGYFSRNEKDRSNDN